MSETKWYRLNTDLYEDLTSSIEEIPPQCPHCMHDGYAGHGPSTFAALGVFMTRAEAEDAQRRWHAKEIARRRERLEKACKAAEESMRK